MCLSWQSLGAGDSEQNYRNNQTNITWCAMILLSDISAETLSFSLAPLTQTSNLASRAHAYTKEWVKGCKSNCFQGSCFQGLCSAIFGCLLVSKSKALVEVLPFLLLFVDVWCCASQMCAQDFPRQVIGTHHMSWHCWCRRHVSCLRAQHCE